MPTCVRIKKNLAVSFYKMPDPSASQFAHARIHPAAEWALQQRFSAIEVDCTTTVVLKILDGKCKMLPGEKQAIMAIYDVIKKDINGIFEPVTYRLIDQARQINESELSDRIHALRVYAEATIPKPVMKRYKAKLREGLFGE